MYFQGLEGKWVCADWRLSSPREGIPFGQGNTWYRATKRGDRTVFDSEEYSVCDGDNWSGP